MTEFGAPATLSSPAGDIQFNTRTPDEYFIENIEGLDGETVDAPIDPRSQIDASYGHDFWARGRHITVTGTLTVDPTLSAYQQVVRRNEMERALRLACKSMKRIGEEGSWAWAPAGVGPYSLEVRCDLQPTYPGKSIKTFVFGLFAEDGDFD